eukprot:TRINITY_DN63071_c0_g1_i1.p2 TRINITY_DN63071_c0_g1~~TRINITY_DN63071_c0_g1_i1.p2  ORF type:complete len:192 (-),score=24.96 TRINITY_DN63071_c0_g1_i1:765-1259(-)
MQHGHGHNNAPQSSTSRYWDDVMSIPGPPRSTPPPAAPSSSMPVAASSSLFPQYFPQPMSDISKPPKPPKASSSSSSRQSSRPRSSRQFQCPQCPSLFERRGHLEAHVETVHEGKRPHGCPHNCGKMFGHRSSLSRHVKSAHHKHDLPSPSSSSSKTKKHYGPL